MGTTSPKGLRYPEPTTLARTLHTRIKELADDINTSLIAHDVRFLGLDNKTNTTNNTLLNTGDVIARYGASAGVFTHSPNDGVNRTINQQINMFQVPSNARTAWVSFNCTGNALVSSAATWEPLVSFTTGGANWLHVHGNAIITHNQGNGVLDMGYHVAGTFNVVNNRGQWGSVANNCANDATSGAWLSQGHLFWSVTFLA